LLAEWRARSSAVTDRNVLDLIDQGPTEPARGEASPDADTDHAVRHGR